MEGGSHSLLLLQQLNIQREFGFLCDCTVAIGNVYFKAHRAVLAAFSNYFKMIFIHQSSECIKLQASDIQPDVFSYLLHIMYSGERPLQPVDRARLQEGVRFLHAHQLLRRPGDTPPDAPGDALRSSNLYGIQISSQLKDNHAPSKGASHPACGAAGDGGGASLESRRSSSPAPPTGGAEALVCVKQEQEEEEEPHLFGHAPCTPNPRLMEALMAEGAGPAEEEEPLEGCLEEALRQSQALANQLAAELRRSRGGGASPPLPPSLLHSRKRKIACAVCSLRFSQKALLQEHMYTHTGKPRPLRYARLLPGSAYFPEGGEELKDNGSSSYSLDSEVSQESDGDKRPITD